MKRPILLALLLAGCIETAETTREYSPIVLRSTKSPAVVSDCIHGAWTGGIYPAVKAPFRDGFTVQLASEGAGPIVIADVLPDAAGTTVSVHAWPYGDFGLTEKVPACL